MNSNKWSSIHFPISERETSELKQFQFGGGESHVQILKASQEQVEILFRYQGDASLIQLLLLTDALKRQGAKHIHLHIPYFPGARQDRVCNEGEALSVKVYADLINSQHFESVIVFDPHSDVTAALLNNVVVVKNHQYIQDIIQEIGNEIIFVSPDAGSNKKIFELSKKLGGVEIIRADKLRDVKNGAILETEVFCGDLTGKTCVIVDDICAGGRTFMELAKKLKSKNCHAIYLVTSHYEGKANQDKLKESGINAMYTTNSLGEYESNTFLKVKNIWNYMPTQGERA